MEPVKEGDVKPLNLAYTIECKGGEEFLKQLEESTYARRVTLDPVSLFHLMQAMGYQVERVNQPGIDDQITECEVIESTLHGNK